jgi:hypothetical protein
LKLNHWALSGDWTVEKEAAVLNAPAPGQPVRFRVSEQATEDRS